jgi:opacity protein-like surface antigen
MPLNQKKLLSISLLGILCAQPAFSNEINNADFFSNFFSKLKSSFVSTLSIGPSWESAGQKQTLNLTPDITKTYTANKPENTLTTGDIFLGIQTFLPKNLQGQIGLDFATTSGATLSGDIWDDADPTFNNYTYQYKIQHKHIALKGKLLGNWNLPVTPWISAALGVGYNKAYGFNNTPTIYEAIQTPNFASRTTTAFTYAVGIGFQRSLTKNVQAGVGYEFSDWGKSQLGRAFTGSSAGLSLSHLYTNSLLFNLTYLA